MSNESVEVQLARLDERWIRIQEDMELSRNSRKAQYEAMEALDKLVNQVLTRVTSLEAQFAKNEPTIEEFITIKHKVTGAGWLGKLLWAGGAGLLGLIASFREEMVHLFSGK